MKDLYKQVYINQAQNKIKGTIRWAKRTGKDPRPILEKQAEQEGLKEDLYRKIYQYFLEREEEVYIGEI